MLGYQVAVAGLARECWVEGVERPEVKLGIRVLVRSC